MGNNELKDLSQIFENDVIYRIPDYQRGYAWQKEQLEDFWEDLSLIEKKFNSLYRSAKPRKYKWERKRKRIRR
ncbi:DUF262 domain-containing protein [Campylobacter jejuni]|nr:DUF262 domain-containing protein [Campylobacter jejuni]EJM9403707.1 DUF262 domain-containing protein [Campylobacter jejuni]ELP5659120.1 DUF262 domain-containing protein [Campylobacter jejuni]HDV7401200.1 DUF262 domain-containing protein [Campylobacter jejuni]